MGESSGVRWGALRSSVAPLLASLTGLRNAVRPLSRRVRVPRSFLLYAMMPALTGVNALVGLLLPVLLGPARFGQYAIVVTLSQYALIFDFGVAQLIDRRIPVLLAEGRTAELQRFTSEALWVRLYIAGGTLICGTVALVSAGAAWTLPFGAGTGVLSLLVGVLSMLLVGPTAVYRATSQRRRFALVNNVWAIALAACRPVGVILGGIPGCFGTLAVCYAALVLWLQADMPLTLADRPGLGRTRAFLAGGVPLFTASFVWGFYLTANRWVISSLASRVELGYFAFGSNIIYLLVGSIAALSQFYYPRVATRFAAGGEFSVSRSVMRDFCGLLLLAAALTAVGIAAGPRMIGVFYPKFVGAEATVRVLLVSLPCLVLSSWLMPLSLSTSVRPWVEGVVIYPAALALLIATTYAGYAVDGIAGASSGFVASALPLLALQLCTLRLTRLITSRDAGILFLATVLVTAALAVLAA